MNKLSATGLILLVGLALAGCNGGSDNNSFGGKTGGTGGAGGGSTAPGDTGGTSTVEFGSGSGSNFQAGQLALGTATLSAGGTTTVKATLVNSDGTPYTTPVSVGFVSNCVQQGFATLDSPVNTINGAATSTYTAKGCSGNDIITATATVNGVQLTATGTVNVAPAALGAVQFVSADPQTIYYHGSGLPETSRVTFEVKDSTGNPLPGENVDFTLSTEVGGIALSQASAKSGADGTVATVVEAGTALTPVRVQATVADTNISTQSSALSISTGIADQDSVSVAPETDNPEAYNYDGITDKVTVRLADRFNNPVPDGTAVSFHTNAGSITPQCTTTGGACTVTWTSQNPRPATGVVNILAFAIGEESFTDKNGNGVFDAGDTFEDMGEPYEDDNNNGQYDPGEFFYDYNQDGVRNGPDGHYEGLQCEQNCGSAGIASGDFTTGIGMQTAIAMATSGADICVQQGGTAQCQPTPLTLTASDFTLLVTDLHGLSMPVGTTVKLSGTNISIDPATSSFTVGNAVAAEPYPIQVGAKADTSKPASITVTVTSPDNVITTAFIEIP